ncbi:MAG TPA: hypothetical protein VFP40_00450, partial [Terriglobales bacterium]|nr:hypothetical protein [Terriglobales bacterium]
MSIFREMHEKRVVDSQREYLELRRMLEEAIDRGYVERVPVVNPSRFVPIQEWFRELETGQIYRLVPPDERGGWWAEVDIADLGTEQTPD